MAPTVAPDLLGPRPLPPGTPAPSFQLRDDLGRHLALSHCLGRRMVLVFYPHDGARASVEVLRQSQAALPLFERLGASVLAISVDPVESHTALASQLGLSFRLLADSEPLGAVARAYGVYWANADASYPAAFVLDEHGIVRWSCRASVGSHPDLAAILRAVSSLGPRRRLATAEPLEPTKEAA